MKKFTALFLALVIFAGLGLTGCQKAGAEYIVLADALAQEEYAIGFRKADRALCAEVERILGEMKEDGTIAKIDKEWFGKETNIFDVSKAITDATDGSLEKVKQAGKFILGLDDSFPPMGYRDDDNTIVGYDIDLAKEVCKRMGVELVLQPIAWAAKEQEINSGNIDCIWNGFTTNAERREALCVSTPYLTNSQVVVTLKSSGIKSLDDLAGKTLAVQGGSSAMDALDENPEIKASLKGGAAVEVDNNVLAMFDLKSGGSDAVLMDKVVADFYVSHPEKGE